MTGDPVGSERAAISACEPWAACSTTAGALVTFAARVAAVVPIARVLDDNAETAAGVAEGRRRRQLELAASVAAAHRSR